MDSAACEELSRGRSTAACDSVGFASLVPKAVAHIQASSCPSGALQTYWLLNKKLAEKAASSSCVMRKGSWKK